MTDLPSITQRSSSGVGSGPAGGPYSPGQTSIAEITRPSLQANATLLRLVPSMTLGVRTPSRRQTDADQGGKEALGMLRAALNICQKLKQLPPRSTRNALHPRHTSWDTLRHVSTPGYLCPELCDDCTDPFLTVAPAEGEFWKVW